MQIRDEKQSEALPGLRTEVRLGAEKQTQALQAVSDKMSQLMEVRERLAVLKDRAKRA